MARPKSSPSKGAKAPKFVSDAMLGSFARKLRILGFDTTYHRKGSDIELISTARNEARIILTSDRQLWSQRSGDVEVILISGKTDRERLVSLKERAKSEAIRLVPLDSRCAVCNGVLVSREKGKLHGTLPETILRRHRIFYVCVGCGKSYWKGTHWSRIRRYSGLLRSKRI